MAHIPGSTIFSSAARQYGENLARTEAFTLSGSSTSSYYKPGNARTVSVIAGGAIDVIVQSASISPRKLNIAGSYSSAGGANSGIISGSLIPHEFAIKDTSTKTNPVTLYFNY